MCQLDGETRSLWMGRREGSVRAVELRRTGAVRLEITLPDGKGMVMDTRRVLPSGSEVSHSKASNPRSLRSFGRYAPSVATLLRSLRSLGLLPPL